MGLMKELNDLNAIYNKMYDKEVSEDENKGYVVTAADKKGNTPAWKGYKACLLYTSPSPRDRG